MKTSLLSISLLTLTTHWSFIFTFFIGDLRGWNFHFVLFWRTRGKRNWQIDSHDMHICIYTYTHVRIYACTHIHIYACTHICIFFVSYEIVLWKRYLFFSYEKLYHTHTHIHVDTNICTHSHKNTRMYYIRIYSCTIEKSMCRQLSQMFLEFVFNLIFFHW